MGKSELTWQEPLDVLQEAAEAVLASWDDNELATHPSADHRAVRLKIEALRYGVILAIRSRRGAS